MIGDEVYLVLWYKGDIATPIYSFDARRGHVGQARHSSSDLLSRRAYFNTIPRPAVLEISPVGPEDEGEYRCRVDFRKAQTRNYQIAVKVLGYFLCGPFPLYKVYIVKGRDESILFLFRDGWAHAPLHICGLSCHKPVLGGELRKKKKWLRDESIMFLFRDGWAHAPLHICGLSCHKPVLGGELREKMAQPESVGLSLDVCARNQMDLGSWFCSELKTITAEDSDIFSLGHSGKLVKVVGWETAKKEMDESIPFLFREGWAHAPLHICGLSCHKPVLGGEFEKKCLRDESILFLFRVGWTHAPSHICGLSCHKLVLGGELRKKWLRKRRSFLGCICQKSNGSGFLVLFRAKNNKR
ncbi:uncharacterized protein CEXT_40581 [Caerostris extrusa]|uniref:Ig-like domain-containing protein n=1 Tax=Caerostris extrusa TaxID=172846 RepID=A0AAV4QG96_CAEEX|nr:uncharacterized protein CEXT_40581 [Caerostris extrusa]